MTYATGSPIVTSDINALRDGLNSLTGPSSGARGSTGYGQSAVGAAVSAGTPIQASNQAAVIDKLRAVLDHQQTPYTPMTTPTAGQPITANPAVTTNYALATSSTNIFSGGIATADLYTVVSPHVYNVYHQTTMTISFGSHQSACHFFNAGGQIDMYAEGAYPMGLTALSIGRIRIGGAGISSAASSQKIDGITYSGAVATFGSPDFIASYLNFYSMSWNPGEVQGFATKTTERGFMVFRYTYDNAGNFTFRSYVEYNRNYGPNIGVDVLAGTSTSLVVRNPTTSALFPKTWTTPTSVSSSFEFSYLSWIVPEPDAVTLANTFWNNRSKFVRYSPYVDYYRSDMDFDNHPGNRYEGDFTRTFSYNNMPATGSRFFTFIAVSSGNVGQNGGIKGRTSTNVGTLINTSGTFLFVGDGAQPSNFGNNSYGISVDLGVYQGDITQLTSTSVSTYSGGGNDGTWIWTYIIPGKWGFVNPVINFAETYTQSIQPGDMHLVLYERGGDFGFDLDPLFLLAENIGYAENYEAIHAGGPWDYTNPAARRMRVDKWWYNGSGAEMWVNTSTWGGGLSYFNLFPGSGVFSMTPRVATLLRQFA
jgi:hypothetical protein